MDIRQLRVFVEVVRHGGFSAAARVIHATQPTVSKAVALLEEEVGTPLLERDRHGVRMTQAGEVVYRRAQAMLVERDDLRAELAELKGLHRGELRLGLPPLGSDMLFAPLFAAYRARYPSIDLHLLEQGSEALEESLLGGRIELAGSLLPVAEAFDAQPVRREPMTVVLAATHPLARRRKLKLVELREEPFLMFERGFTLNRRILAACRKRGFEPREATRSGQIAFIVALAAAGMGVALLPRMIAEDRRRPDVAVALLDEPDMDWHMAMVWRRSAFLSHAAQAWLALVRETYATGTGAASASR